MDDDDLPEYAFDPETLHESYVGATPAAQRIDALRAGIRTAPDEIGELVARGDLVALLRATGELDDALHEGLAAVDRAEIAGTRVQQHTARARLAQVHQWRGEFGESNLMTTELLAAVDRFGPVVEAFTHQQAGLNDYDQGHWDDAYEHFARALALRDELELPDDERGASRLAVAAADRHRAAQS